MSEESRKPGGNRTKSVVARKTKTREELARICRRERKRARTIGFSSGVFDIIHAGHVDYLERAKGKCDILIVGINSDASVRRFKGKGRPIVPQRERAKVVAALESVDYCFIFNERRNKKNIELLKPDLYLKAGDYSKEELTSSEIVEKYGGKVRLIPVRFKTSTSSIIDRVSRAEAAEGSSSESIVAKGKTVYFHRRPWKVSTAVFIDRDGTINEEIEYLHEVEKLRLLPNAAKGIKKMQDMGYEIVILTNQPGIGWGYFKIEDFYRVNKGMLRELSSEGVTVSKIYFCPHTKAENCRCRKPGTALLMRARTDLNLDIGASYVIGDRTSDIECARRAGAKTILVRTGIGGSDKEFNVKPDYVADDLLDAAGYILSQERL